MPLFYLRIAAAVPAFAAALAYGVILALLRRDRSRVLHDTARAVAALVLPVLGLRVAVRGAANLEAWRPCVYIANHQNILDIPVVARILPPGTVLIGKRELLRYPLLGWLFAATGNVPIDRSDTRRAVASLKVLETEVRRRGVSVWIFPEGTWGPTPGRLLPFKMGAFDLAFGAGVPLVPVVIEPLGPFLDRAARRRRGGTVEVWVLEPIPAAAARAGGADALRDEAQARMQAALDALADARAAG